MPSIGSVDLKITDQKDLSRYFTNFDIPQFACLHFGDAKFLVNSVILSMHSSRFDALIGKGYEQIRIAERNLTLPIVRDCLGYLHGLNITVTPQNVYQLYEFSSIYCIEPLKLGCINFADKLMKSLNVQKTISMFLQYPGYALTKRYLKTRGSEVVTEILRNEKYSWLWKSENVHFFRRLAENCTSQLCGSLLLRLYQSQAFDNLMFSQFLPQILLPEKLPGDPKDYQTFISKYKVFAEKNATELKEMCKKFQCPSTEGSPQQVKRDFVKWDESDLLHHKEDVPSNATEQDESCASVHLEEDSVQWFNLDSLIMFILGVTLPFAYMMYDTVTLR